MRTDEAAGELRNRLTGCGWSLSSHSLRQVILWKRVGRRTNPSVFSWEWFEDALAAFRWQRRRRSKCVTELKLYVEINTQGRRIHNTRT